MQTGLFLVSRWGGGGGGGGGGGAKRAPSIISLLFNELQ